MDSYTLTDDQMAAVPFSPEGLQYLSTEASWDSLTDSEAAREVALHRIRDACKINDDLTPLSEDYSKDALLLSYPLSRIIISHLGNPFLKHLYVLSEAKRVVSHSEQIWTSDPNQQFTNLQLLDHLECPVTITNNNNKIPTSQYNKILPTEIQPRMVKSDSIILNNSEEVDLVLYWKCVAIINENLPVRVPESFESEFEDVIGTVSGLIPPEFQLTKRGTGEELSYSSFEKVSQLFPPSIKQIGKQVVDDQIVSNEERDLFIKSLLDCNIETEKIIDWFGWSSEFTDSYGSDLIYSLQGDISTEELGIHTNALSQLQSDGIIQTPSLLFKLSEYPCVYALLNDSDELTPMNLRDSNL